MNNTHMTAAQMLKRLQALAFAKTECELYLDAYPECMPALDHYKSIVKEYRDFAEKYENEYGPIRQENIFSDSWTWVKTPWPWQVAE